MKTPKVLVFNDHIYSSCAFWRSQLPFQELDRNGDIVMEVGEYNHEDWTNLRRFDIALFQRPMSKQIKNQIFMAHDMGCKIWIDIDDYHEIPPYHPVYPVYKDVFDEKIFMQYMMMADVVTVTNDYLKKHYLQYNNNVVVVPNALNDHWLKIQKFKETNNALIRGGDHHDHDMYLFKDQIIQSVNKNKWHLNLIGNNPVYFQLEIPEYNYVGDFNIHDYFAYILRADNSVFIVPLVFN